MDHAYRIDGHINSRPVQGVGHGRTDPATGISETEIRFSLLPDTWDPRSIVLMCCERATATAARPLDGAVGLLHASGGRISIGRDLVSADRRGIIRDIEGNIWADVRASSTTDLRASQPYDHSRIEGGICHIHHGANGIAEVQPFSGVMMQAGPRLITVTTRYELTLDDGTTLYGTTFYPHYLPHQRTELPGMQLISVHRIQQELSGDTLWMHTETEITPLSRSPVHQPPAEHREPVKS